MGYQKRTPTILAGFTYYAWVGAILPTVAIAGANFTFNYPDTVSGWSTSSPLSQEAYTSLALLTGYIDKLEMLFEHFNEVPFYVIMPTIEKTVKDIEDTCHNCKHPEFKLVLENGLLNKATTLVLEIKRRGKSERATQIFGELQERFKQVSSSPVGAVVACYSTAIAVR